MANQPPQKQTLFQHIIENPSKYIGSVEPVKEHQWLYKLQTKNTDENDNTTATKGYMIQKEITYVPGLYKIFNEILMNAVAHKTRDENMSKIEIDINQATNTISIRNDGSGIPYFIRDRKHMLAVLFGLNGELCQSNLKQKVGGAKLTNIFCTSFKVQTSTKGTYFDQEWTQNMKTEGNMRYKPDVKFGDLTRVTFRPDLSKFTRR